MEKTARSAQLLAIVGPSGAGKTEIALGLARLSAEYAPIRTCTTRSPRTADGPWVRTASRRAGSKTDGDYDFVDDDAFRRMSAEGELVALTERHDAMYGVPRKELTGLPADKVGVLVLDEKGALEIATEYPDCVIALVQRDEKERTGALAARYDSGGGAKDRA